MIVLYLQYVLIKMEKRKKVCAFSYIMCGITMPIIINNSFPMAKAIFHLMLIIVNIGLNKGFDLAMSLSYWA